MAKLTYKDKINLYKEYKKGISISNLSSKYNKRSSGISYLIKLIDIRGYDILKTINNKKYSRYFKQDAIDRVLLNNEPIWTVALDIGLASDGMLHAWINKYKENGYNIVERKRGRSTMPKVAKKLKQIRKKLKGLSPVNYRLQSSN